MKMCSESINEIKYTKLIAEGKEYNFEEVNQFHYLGVTVTSTNQEENEIDLRILEANRAVESLSKMLGAKNISSAVKIRAYETSVRHAVET